MLVGVFNRISATKGCVCNVCVSGVVDALPKRYTNRIVKATKTCPAHKLYWRPLNLKRSLPVLKWTSDREYFFSFKKFSSPRAIT